MVLDMNVGVIGNGADKFTSDTEKGAKAMIGYVLSTTLLPPNPTVVSGRSPLGGVDVWAEEYADEHGLNKIIHAPKRNHWGGVGGYRHRNLLIARDSDIIYVIVAHEYPPDYKDMRFKSCYHCNKNDHVKSGACWTAKKAMKMDKPVEWVIIDSVA